MRIGCDIEGCHCRHILFTVTDFHGKVETKCPRCRSIHMYTFGDGCEPTTDVRCNNSFKGQDLGGWCGQLVARISSDAYGDFGYRCPRCKDDKTIRITTPVLVST